MDVLVAVTGHVFAQSLKIFPLALLTARMNAEASAVEEKGRKPFSFVLQAGIDADFAAPFVPLPEGP